MRSNHQSPRFFHEEKKPITYISYRAFLILNTRKEAVDYNVVLARMDSFDPLPRIMDFQRIQQDQNSSLFVINTWIQNQGTIRKNWFASNPCPAILKRIFYNKNNAWINEVNFTCQIEAKLTQKSSQIVIDNMYASDIYKLFKHILKKATNENNLLKELEQAEANDYQFITSRACTLI